MLTEQDYWQLEYEERRACYQRKYPEQYAALQALRTEEPAILRARSFKPFIDHECIFVHIPKTAGISVGYSLFGRHTGNHATVAEYQIAFSEEEFARFFKFTFVRNPWDRLLSAFLFMKKGGRNQGDLNWSLRNLAPYKTFEKFVLRWVNPQNIQKGQHFRPQHQFITTPASPEPQVDFIGYFEKLSEDYQVICDRLGIGQSLTFENRTVEKEDYRSYYNPRTIEIVAEVYRRDIELFGYSFEAKKG